MRDLTGHLGPGFEPVRAFELRALRLQLRRHAVECVDEAAELVGGAHRDPRVEIARCNAARGAGQPAHRIGDALGQRQPDRGAKQHEAQDGEMNAAIEVVDLALDLPLARGQWDRQDAIALAGPDRRRGDDVRNGPNLILVDETRAGDRARWRGRPRRACA